jgi:erythronate-4-phosphate dehydrogenase
MLIVADAKIPDAENAFRQFGEVKVVPTKQMVHAAIRDADILFVRSETRINASLLRGTAVRFVGTATIGTDHVDLEYLKRNDIAFASCPGSNANSVAEYVLAAMLEVGSLCGFSLPGKTMGIVGHGNTGSRVAQKAEAIGMNVLLNDPPLARATGDSRYLSLDVLMGADIVSLHVPLTTTGEDATFHLFDGRRLSAMKAESVLINSSRGAVVETRALKSALARKHFRACVLDVWEHEPTIDTELLSLVTLATPHIAGYSHDGKLNATAMLQQALSEFLHQPLEHAPRVAAELKEVVLPGDKRKPEELLRYAVRECYNILSDDQRLRELLRMPEERRPDFFRELRAKYPKRREFHNYRVNTKALTPEFSRIAALVGFITQ